MEIYDEFSSEIMADYANILADVILGKNAEKHLLVIDESLDALNSMIDYELQDGRDAIMFIKIAYCYYKLKAMAEMLV